jgi:hypothetical protein
MAHLVNVQQSHSVGDEPPQFHSGRLPSYPLHLASVLAFSADGPQPIIKLTPDDAMQGSRLWLQVFAIQ